MRWSVRALCLCLLAAVALPAMGCLRGRVWRARHRGPVVVEPGPAVAAPAEIIVETEPPPLRVEVQPPCPVPGHAWCPGYWNWQGGRHVWVGGRWAAPPRRGAAWVAPRWERGPRGHRFHPGLWR